MSGADQPLPPDTSALLARADALVRAGRFADARPLYEAVLRVAPTAVLALTNLGSVHFRLGDARAAAACYRRALVHAPTRAVLHTNLAQALRQLGDFAAAAQAADAAHRLAPRDVDVLNLLGICLYELGRLRAAGRCFALALRLDPRSARAANNLGGICKATDRPAAALRLHQRAAALEPTFFEAHENVGKVHEEEGRIADARTAYERALALRSEPLLALHASLLCPPVFEDGAALERYRRHAAAVLDAWSERPLAVDLQRLQSSRAEPPFDWAYHGDDNLALKRRYAALFADAFPHQPARGSAGPRLRVGFVVTPTHEGIFARCMGGILQRLDRRRIEPVLVCAQPSEQALRAAVPDAATLRLPLRFDQMAAAIRAAAFDVLYFWEVGTDSMNYFLPFCRLAPVQCTGWGWPDTSGAPALDYHLTSALLANAADQRAFSERLVRLPHLPPCFPRPPVPPGGDRDIWGLPPSSHRYVCLQNLRKVHPDFDPMLGAILRADPDAVAIFVHDRAPAIGDLLRRRWQRTLPDVVDRIRLLPRLTAPQYFQLIAASDVVLDTPHFSGCNTTYDALAMGVPVVTLPGSLPRGRYSAALCRVAGVDDTVAVDAEDFARRAVRLGTDDALRRATGERIRAAAPLLFENAAAVAQFENFLIDAHASGRRD